MTTTTAPSEHAAPPSGDGTAPTAFSVLLREATREEHTAAEGRGFITRLMGGQLAEEDYWRMLAQYLPLYEALEEATEQAAARHALVARFHDPRFARVAAIRQDFSARFGPEHRIEAPLPITARYAARLRGASAPQLLAHHYLRYLGDLSGGQAIGALVARHYGIPCTQLTMWDFSEIDAPKRVKDAYRRHLDEITDPTVREEFLAEAKVGYELAGELFAALER